MTNLEAPLLLGNSVLEQLGNWSIDYSRAVLILGERKGCTNPRAFNYNPNAITDDGSCEFLGCTSPRAENYSPTATKDDGSCVILGCTSLLAENYSPIATKDNDTCEFLGCTNPSAENYSAIATIDDGSCVVLGCTNSKAINYSPKANKDNGSCIIGGCTNAKATNYSPSAVRDDGSCIIPGCTNPNAENYSAIATRDNGTCNGLGPTIGDISWPTQDHDSHPLWKIQLQNRPGQLPLCPSGFRQPNQSEWIELQQRQRNHGKNMYSLAFVSGLVHAGDSKLYSLPTSNLLVRVTRRETPSGPLFDAEIFDSSSLGRTPEVYVKCVWDTN